MNEREMDERMSREFHQLLSYYYVVVDHKLEEVISLEKFLSGS